jgi:hypothetical protein
MRKREEREAGGNDTYRGKGGEKMRKGERKKQKGVNERSRGRERKTRKRKGEK